MDENTGRGLIARRLEACGVVWREGVGLVVLMVVDTFRETFMLSCASIAGAYAAFTTSQRDTSHPRFFVTNLRWTKTYL